MIFIEKVASQQFLEGNRQFTLQISGNHFQEEGTASYTTWTKCCIFNSPNNPRKRFYYLCFTDVGTGPGRLNNLSMVIQLVSNKDKFF